MAADGVHGAIGRKMKNKYSIINFQDFIDICKSSQVNINPIVMENRDFRFFRFFRNMYDHETQFL